MNLSKTMSLIFVVLTMVLSSFCAIEEKENSLRILYAGKTVSICGLFLIMGGCMCYLGTLLGFFVFFACVFPIPHRTVGWIIALPGVCRVLRASHDPDLAADALRRYYRGCKICGCILTILYAVFLVLSFVFVESEAVLKTARFWHVLIFLAVLVVLALLRKPVMFYVSHKYRQVTS